VSGFYVIDYLGDAITVHCATLTDERIGVQFMSGPKNAHAVALDSVEPMLLGKMVMSQQQQTALLERED
jgi:hypothetical protein